MKTSVLAATAISLCSLPASAQMKSYSQSTKAGVTTTKERLQKGKDVERITCKQFNALEDTFKPEAIGLAVRYTMSGKAKDPKVDVAGVDRITPVVIKECQTRTSEPLLTRIKDAFHRL